VIPVKKQPPPANFVEKVEKPGNKLLAENPHPKKSELKPYWRQIERELYEAYRGICAYSCLWIPHITGGRTVEHFKPTSKYPQDAYIWDNYRLVCRLLNGRKREFEDVLDPFTLQDGWFVIDFSSLMIFSADHLPEEEASQVTNTVKRLRLNEDEDCIKEREKWLRDYVTEEISFTHLEKHAPFIALELKRQELVARAHPIWAEYRKQKEE
jgi:hypothetical protein